MTTLPDLRRLTAVTIAAVLLATSVLSGVNTRRADASPVPISSLWVMNADGSELLELAEFVDEWSGFEWSPDGSALAFSSQGLSGDIFLVDPDGGEPRNLTSSDFSDGLGQERSPTWSPNGDTPRFRGRRGYLDYRTRRLRSHEAH